MEIITDQVNGGIARLEGAKHEQGTVPVPMSRCGRSLVVRGDAASAATSRGCFFTT